MWKKWLLALPILFNLLSCEGLSFGGNSNEGNRCSWISKEFVSPLKFELSVTCSYEKICKGYFSYWGFNISDSLRNKCFSGYELNFVTKDTSMLIRSIDSYPISFESDSYLRFTLLDINNVEKKYDIDLSGIVNSYTVRGDTVDVNVMKQCKISVFTKPHKTEIFGNTISNSLYSFSILDSREPWLGYECSWKQVGPLKKDDLEVYAKLHW